MILNGILSDLQNDFDFDLSIEAAGAILTNRDTRAYMEIYDESYASPDDGVIVPRYTVSFAGQHRHFEDLTQTKRYVERIMKDEILPITFFLREESRFGGEISQTEAAALTKERLAARFGYAPEDLTGYAYEIHSWSGRYDTGRLKIE